MNLVNWFDLEKKSDGLYRCKGGPVADVILLCTGIFFCLIMAILEIPKTLIRIIEIKLFSKK